MSKVCFECGRKLTEKNMWSIYTCKACYINFLAKEIERLESNLEYIKEQKERLEKKWGLEGSVGETSEN